MRLKDIVILNAVFVIYSLAGVFIKFAAGGNRITIRPVLLYGAAICLMGLYAIVWQQVIKRIPLMVAYSNKAIIVLWGLIWGILFFKETLTIGKIIGLGMVIVGIILFARSYKEDAKY